jgi:hypothetical protein
MDEKDILEMKKYIAVDIEGFAKSIDADEWDQWTEVADEDVIDWNNKKKQKPFSYDNMLMGVMEYLESTGNAEFAILKDPELGRWWAGKVKKREHNKRIAEAKEKLNSVLSKEEQKLLGIKI